jgi:hypothetical protein
MQRKGKQRRRSSRKEGLVMTMKYEDHDIERRCACKFFPTFESYKHEPRAEWKWNSLANETVNNPSNYALRMAFNKLAFGYD